MIRSKVPNAEFREGFDRVFGIAKMDTASRGRWMQTHTNRAWHFEDPRAEDVDILDIAHALGNLCRYGGHCRSFYSVAEHSYWVSHIVPPEDALAGLLHDATEAYVCDVPRPLKHLLTNYKATENRQWEAIAAAFGLPTELPESVKEADNAMLFVEKDQLLDTMPPEFEASWGMGCVRRPGLDVRLHLLSPRAATAVFLKRFKELTE